MFAFSSLPTSLRGSVPVRRGVALLAGALLLAFTVACDSNGSGGDDSDTPERGYQVTVSGAVSLKESGLAQFTDPRDSDATGWQFTVELTRAAPIRWQGDDYYFNVFVSNRQLASLPSSESYNMVSYFDEDSADEFSGEFSLSPADGDGDYVRFEATSGTVTFSSVEDERLKGDVEFTGTRADTGDTVTVKGSFNATRAIPTI
jgi:hypothetical protein